MSGFSLVELMVTVGIMGVVTMGMMSMMQNQVKTIQYLEDRMAMMNLRNELALNLQSAAVCEATLKGVRITDNPQEIEIVGKNGAPLLSSVDEKMKQFETILIDKITVMNIDVPNNLGNGWVEFKATARRTRTGGGPETFRPAVYRTRVMADSSGTILSCDADRITALDCGKYKNGETVSREIGACPQKFLRTDICVAGLWLLYEKKIDPRCKSS